MIVLNTHKNDPSGLGIVARMASSLGEVVDDSRSCGGKIFVPGRPDTHKDLVNPKGKNYIWTTFESTQIPRGWVDEINQNYREVFVPHQSIRTAFISSGVDKPVQVVPQGFTRYDRTVDYQKWDGKSELRIGMLGVPTKRKNLVRLFSAIERLNIEEKQNIKLVIHAPWLVTDGQEILQHSPFVELTTGTKTDMEIADWYSSLHAYIYPSSGEGWSFTPREAMYMGIPTIISDIDVHNEMIESGFSCPIKSDTWEDAYYEFLSGTCGQWKKYTVEDIMRGIRAFIDDYDAICERLPQQRNWIDERYRWEDALKQIKAEIEPKHIMFCPTKHQACGINTYTNDLVKHLPDTKYVGSYDEVMRAIQEDAIQSVHVQHEFGIFNSQELQQNAQKWHVKKQITLHTVANDAGTMGQFIAWFDDVFVLNKKSIERMPDAKYVPHGTSLPIHVDAAKKQMVGTFGFIHPQKGYEYIVKASQLADMPLRIVGALNRDNERSMELYNTHIRDQRGIEHLDGFFPQSAVMRYLSECSLLVYYYEDGHAIYTSGSILQAARLGIPIITSDSVVFNDFEGCVYKVPQKDENALYEAIRHVSGNVELQKQLISNFNEYLKQNQWQNIAKNFQ